MGTERKKFDCRARKNPSRGGRVAPKLVTALLVVVLMSGCTGDSASPLKRSSLDAQGSEATVELNDVTDQEWASAVIVCPYQDEDLVEQRLGIAYPLDTMRDTITSIVFATADEVEDVVRIRTYDDANLCTMSAPVLEPGSQLVLERTDTWELISIS